MGLGGVSPTRWCGSFEPVLYKIFALYYFLLEAFGLRARTFIYLLVLDQHKRENILYSSSHIN